MNRDRILLMGALATLATLAAAVPACTSASTKTEPTDEFQSIVDAKADNVGSIAGHPSLVGSLDYGQTSDAVAYTSGRLAFKFAGAVGDSVDIWVRSDDGDAVAWLYNDDGRRIALNDDADGATLDSHISATLIANRNPDIHTYYIVFRDYDHSRATFTIALKGPGCSYDGKHYKAGQGFPSSDGCNTCSCTASGRVICTERACPAPSPQGHTCGGNIVNAYQCPSGYKCMYHPTSPAIAGAPGTCEQLCGGFAARPCTNVGTSCTDDWTDSCDPAHGGADCGGVCETNCPAGQTYDTTTHKCVQQCLAIGRCVTGYHWDTTTCGCAKDACLIMAFCIQGYTWDANSCACVPATCTQTALCIQGFHWDGTQCKCVTN